MTKIPNPAPWELHEQARREVLHVLNNLGGPEGKTLDEVTRLSGLPELRALRALQELVLMRIVGKRGKAFFSLPKGK
jgi:DNA-binding IclR family transcriptional regulator